MFEDHVEDTPEVAEEAAEVEAPAVEDSPAEVGEVAEAPAEVATTEEAISDGGQEAASGPVRKDGTQKGGPTRG